MLTYSKMWDSFLARWSHCMWRSQGPIGEFKVPSYGNWWPWPDPQQEHGSDENPTPPPLSASHHFPLFVSHHRLDIVFNILSRKSVETNLLNVFRIHSVFDRWNPCVYIKWQMVSWDLSSWYCFMYTFIFLFLFCFHLCWCGHLLLWHIWLDFGIESL